MKLKATMTQVLVLLPLGVSLMNAQTVWVTDSLQRVGPSAAAGAGVNIALYAAKGESESFQVVVKAPSTGLSGINLTTSGLTGPNGATIPPADFTFYREFYVQVTQPSPDFGIGNRPLGAGWYPDALIPFVNPATGAALSGATYDAVPAVLAANQNQPFWIDVNVPRGAVAGTYTGTVTVSSTLGSTAVDVSLTVWNFTLPVKPNLKSSFGYNAGWGNLQNSQLLLQHRLQPFGINTKDISTLISDGMTISGLPYFNQSSGCTIETPPSVSTLAAAVQQYPAGFPTYVYPADEVSGCPNLAQNLQLWAQVAHDAGTKTLVTVPPQSTLLDDGTGAGRTDVDFWAMLPKQFCTNIKVSPCVPITDVPVVLAKGNEIWSYSEQEQDYYSPKWLLDFAPINYRIMPGFINQQFGFTGMLYSQVNLWSTSPWTNVQAWQAAGYTFPGDGMLVYPGQQVGLSSVVPSMRLKFIRDGIDDYDYIAMLKSQGQTAFVDTILNSVVGPDFINWTKSTATLQSARIQMGQELDRLAGGGGASTTTLQAPSNPWPASGTAAPATSLTLQCDAVSGATQYQVYLGTSATNLTLHATVAASGSVVRSAAYFLSGATTYFWKVVASNGSSSASGPVWSFTTPSTTTTLQPPSNPWPASGTTASATSLTLECSSVSGATQYHVYFGTTSSSLPLYTTVTAFGSIVKAPVYNLKTVTTYYWKVVATNGTTSATSPVWSFKTP